MLKAKIFHPRNAHKQGDSMKLRLAALACILSLLASQPAEAGRLKAFVRKSGAVAKGLVILPVSMFLGAGIAAGGVVFGVLWHFDEINREEGVYDE